jgi:NAD(P)-dependent dehydrogenase (short-subunit alcohol dehydrogenase family)
VTLGADLRGQVALVTGGGRGIGRAVSLALGRAGARVVLAARTAAEIEAVSAKIARAGGEATAVPADVSREEDVVGLFGRVGERLDILVNNAGLGIFGPLDAFSAADFDRVLGVNLRGTFLCCREAMKRMERRRGGWIINVSSVVGIKGYPNQAAYTASKHGIVGLTKSLAVEAQPHGIRVSVILPGGVDTGMAGQARPDLERSVLLQPEDIAQTVLYLLSLSDRAAVDEIYIRRRTSPPF